MMCLPAHRSWTHRPALLIRAVLATIVLAATVVVAGAAPASADARMPVQISPQAPSVQSGEYLSYNAFIGCSIPEGCPNAVLTFSAPPGASGAGVVAQPYPPGVTSVVQLPNGDVQVTFAAIGVGTTKQLTVSWPTADYYTVPGPQPITVTATSDTATSPSTASTTMDVTATPNPSIAKQGPATVPLDTEFTYAIQAYNYSSFSRGGLALQDAAIVDHLPDGLQFVSASNGGIWDPVARTVTWHPDTNGALPGSQFAGSVGYSITVLAPSSADPSLVGSTLTNTATITGEPLGGGDPITKEAHATTGVIATGTPVPSFVKYAPTTVGDGQQLVWDLRVTNSGTAVGSAVISDVFPSGVEVQQIVYANSGTQVTVAYADGTTADVTFTGSAIDIAKAGTRPASVVVHTTQIPIGGTAIVKFGGIAHVDELPAGSTALQNCADVEMGGQTVSDCADTTLTAPQVSGRISKHTSQEPINPGGTLTWTVDVSSSAAPLSPRIIDLLPTQLEYVQGSFAFVSTQAGTCPAASDYTVQVVPNYQNGRAALTVVGKDGVTLDAGTQCRYQFQTLVKPGSPAGSYTGSDKANWIYLYDDQDQIFQGTTYDYNDIDHDGVTDEQMAYGGDSFAVALSSAADIVKQVRGDQDSTWLGSAEVPGQADQVGTSYVGGTVQWQLAMGNQGNRDLTNLVAYDLLPDPASPGITDGRYGDTKPYEWVPTLTGPIDTGGAPVTITYSTKTDPCRPEMDATGGTASFWCNGVVDPSFVPASSVADWSAIRSVRFDFGDHTFPGGEYFTFHWTMDVPTVGPDGQPLQTGDETWNKAAVQADRLNGDGTTLPLLPAEAPWVVDKVAIPPVPAIDIEKADAAGNDADTTADTVRIDAGTPTDLVFTVTNTGTEDLTDVTVTDAVTAGDAIVDGLSCDFSALGGPSSGTTWAGPFQVGDSFTCTATLSALAAGVAHTDVASVTGTGVQTGTEVSDDDAYHAATPAEPAIVIVKADAAGNDANTTADQATVPSGETTALVFTVTNSGNEPLIDVTVTDAVTDGDATVTGLVCTFPDGSKGTTWAGSFAVDASFPCLATLSALTPGLAHADVATVTGTGANSHTPVTDDDPYHAITPATPDITIVKEDAAGNDANTAADAVTVPQGDATSLVFTVTNSGDEPLVGVAVTDAVTEGDGAIRDLTCDFSPLSGPSSGTVWAGAFQVGDSFTCTATLGVLTPGVPHADVAAVSAVGQHSGTTVTDDDPYHATTAAVPSVHIVKQDAAGHDADTTADAVTVADGASTDLVFTVRNEGNEPLADVHVSDAVTDGDATVAGLTCDFSPLGGPSSGTTWAGPFEVGDAFTCTATLSALTPGIAHTDVATVTGTGVHSGTSVTDDDPFHATTPPAPAVQIVKTDAAGHDANTSADQVTVPVGDQTGLVFTITNRGTEPLVDVVVTDTVTGGDATVTGLACTFPDGSTGTTWDGPLAVGASFPCLATLSALTPGVAHVDAATVTGTGRYSGTTVTDDDPFHAITPATPEVTIVKTDAAGHDANTASDAVTVANGSTTSLVFTSTNTGNEPLIGIAVTDQITQGSGTVTDLSCDFSALGGPATGTTWAGPLEVGESFTCTATLSALEPGSSHTDVATVSAAGQYSGSAVHDDDPYHATTPPLVSVGDHVWFDTDRDGVQDPTEAPVPNVVVRLYDAHGTLVATTSTDATGFYSFTDLKASTDYQIEFVAPDGASFTGSDLGGSDAADSDADTGTGRTVTFTTPATGDNSATAPDDPTWDAGLVQLDLTITKTLETAGPFRPGQVVTFTLVPHNAGPVAALAGWSVTDVLPAGLTLDSIAGTGYRCDGDTITCTDVTDTVLLPGSDGGPITVRATIGASVAGRLHNVAYVRPAPGDVDETNPLVVPDTSTDTSTSGTNNDDQASLVVEPVPTATTTAPPAVDHTQTSVPGAGHQHVDRGNLARTGSDLVPLVALALGLTAAGLGLVGLSRRRVARGGRSA